MTKQARLYAIKEIIARQPVGSQKDLRARLAARGFRVTQATLSRDLGELGVSRSASGSAARYTLPPEAELKILRPLVGAEVVSIQANECLVVVRTLPGCANTVGEYVDVQNHPDVLGTVAGDNTLVVIPASTRKTSRVVRFLRTTLIEGGE